jgi:hypothetical protein
MLQGPQRSDLDDEGRIGKEYAFQDRCLDAAYPPLRSTLLKNERAALRDEDQA